MRRPKIKAENINDQLGGRLGQPRVATQYIRKQVESLQSFQTRKRPLSRANTLSHSILSTIRALFGSQSARSIDLVDLRWSYFQRTTSLNYMISFATFVPDRDLANLTCARFAVARSQQLRSTTKLCRWPASDKAP